MRKVIALAALASLALTAQAHAGTTYPMLADCMPSQEAAEYVKTHGETTFIRAESAIATDKGQIVPGVMLITSNQKTGNFTMLFFPNHANSGACVVMAGRALTVAK